MKKRNMLIICIMAVTAMLAAPFKWYWEKATRPGIFSNKTVTAGNVIEGAKSRGVAKFSYDFDSQGGAAGDISMQGEPLPKNAIVWDGVADVITVPESGGSATIAISTAQSANDLITAAAISGSPWSTTGLKALVPVGDAAHGIKMTADRHPQLTIAVADLTKGKINLFIEYYLSDSA